MNGKLVYLIPELLELDVPEGVVVGTSGRNVDLRADDKLWTHFTDDTDDDVPKDADSEDIP